MAVTDERGARLALVDQRHDIVQIGVPRVVHVSRATRPDTSGLPLVLAEALGVVEVVHALRKAQCNPALASSTSIPASMAT